MKPYEMTDKAVEKITDRLNQEFRHNRLALFDEANVVQTRKHIKKLYKSAHNIIVQEFLPILNDIYKENCGKEKDFNTVWLDKFFREYDAVTQYVFLNELDRKESRLFEAVVSSPETKQKAYSKARDLLVRQIEQEGIELEDKIILTAYKDSGVEKVKWVAEHDGRTCEDCKELDGQEFELDEIPDKHYRCRCYVVPVEE